VRTGQRCRLSVLAGRNCLVVFRHIVVADAAFRKHSTDANLFLIPIRRSLFSNHVLAKARSATYSEDATDRSGDRSDCSANDSTRRSCRAKSQPRLRLYISKPFFGQKLPVWHEEVRSAVSRKGSRQAFLYAFDLLE
jgi:hypothetical protein